MPLPIRIEKPNCMAAVISTVSTPAIDTGKVGRVVFSFLFFFIQAAVANMLSRKKQMIRKNLSRKHHKVHLYA